MNLGKINIRLLNLISLVHFIFEEEKSIIKKYLQLLVYNFCVRHTYSFHTRMADNQMLKKIGKTESKCKPQNTQFIFMEIR